MTDSPKLGRPTMYTDDLAVEICQRLIEGETLKSICSSEHMPQCGTVFRWLADEKHKTFSDMYAHAREAQMEAMAEEILEIADDSAGDELVDKDGNARANSEYIQRAKLRVDTRKWIMSKIAPRKYGEKQTVDQNVTMKDEVTDTEAARRVALLLDNQEVKEDDTIN